MVFKFKGEIHSSKSLVNRLLILQRAYPELKLEYNTTSQDVLDMQRLLKEFDQGETEFFVGNGGTTFRFFSLWLSRQKGSWTLNLGDQLSHRPQAQVIDCLQQVGVKAEMLTGSCVKIQGQPWDLSKIIKIDISESTQFFSGFVLAAVGEKKEIKINLDNIEQASGYEQMTLNLLKKLDFLVEEKDSHLLIKPPVKLPQVIKVGADWSSIFYLSLFAFSDNSIEISNVDFLSPEPDRQGYEILKQLGLSYEQTSDSTLKISPSKLALKSYNFDFRKNPDLFPGFCALITQMDYKDLTDVFSITFPWQLKIKESDRLKNSLELLQLFNVKYSKVAENKIIIEGRNEGVLPEDIEINTYDDHRMFMSAEFLRSKGHSIKTSEVSSYKKSFPEFLEIVRG